MGYPPVSGRLHTRYSPVRRSPSKYCYFMLPLDLHVLSLSLAFILSQDQTLHSIKTLKKLSLSLSHYSFIIFSNDRIALAVYLSPFNILKNSSCFSSEPRPVLGAKADAKIIPISHSLQIFLHLFFKIFQNLRFSFYVTDCWFLPRCVSESGCKGKDFFITSKFFRRNF